MATTISVSVYSNSDDAFVAWAPSDSIPGCRGFQLERGRKSGADETIDLVENRTGFAKDNPQSGEHRSSSVWPFQRFDWTDHAVDVGATVRYRVTAMLASGDGLVAGPASDWTPWIELTADAGDGFSCYFNRGLVLSQFVARYLRDKKISPEVLKTQLQTSTDPAFRGFLQGDLGARLFKMLSDAQGGGPDLHAALYELDDDALETAMIGVGGKLHLVLSNGSGKTQDGNADSRKRLNDNGVPTIDRLLRSKGLGHNKFVVGSDAGGPRFVWTGSTNWSTTGLCTQINNGLLIEDPATAEVYRRQWDRLKAASPPVTTPAGFTPALVAANDTPTDLTVGAAKVTVRFTPTSDGGDMDAVRDLINGAKSSILFLMFTPGPSGLHTLAAQRATEKSMYVKGVVSTLGLSKADSAKNVLDIQLVSGGHAFPPDRYTVVQPQGEGGDIGPWIGEVTRDDFLAQVGHAIVHSKILLIDHMTDDPVVITGSHNFSNSASTKNDENLVFVRGHKALARAYAAHIMSVYQHYRYRSYIREMQAQGKVPWSQLDDNDLWLKDELVSKAAEIAFWTQGGDA